MSDDKIIKVQLEKQEMPEWLKIMWIGTMIFALFSILTIMLL